MERIRASLIGYGKWGKVLLPYLDKRFDVAYVYGRSLPKQGRFTNRLSDALGGGIGAVVVATPIGAHYSIVYEALERGKHVFCEKPLTTNFNKALELIGLARLNNVQLVTDYTYTFSERLRGARVGQPMSMRMALERTTLNGDNPYWMLASHMVAVLGMFTNLLNLKFTIYNDMTSTKHVISFSGDIEGEIVIDTQAKKTTYISLTGTHRYLEFINLAEDDNLNYALDYFENVISGEISNVDNLECAYRVTKTLNALGIG